MLSNRQLFLNNLAQTSDSPLALEIIKAEGVYLYDSSGKKRIAAQLWALTPRIYLVNGSRDLMTNIGKAIAAGFLALSDF